VEHWAACSRAGLRTQRSVIRLGPCQSQARAHGPGDRSLAGILGPAGVPVAWGAAAADDPRYRHDARPSLKATADTGGGLQPRHRRHAHSPWPADRLKLAWCRICASAACCWATALRPCFMMDVTWTANIAAAGWLLHPLDAGSTAIPLSDVVAHGCPARANTPRWPALAPAVWLGPALLAHRLLMGGAAAPPAELVDRSKELAKAGA